MRNHLLEEDQSISSQDKNKKLNKKKFTCFGFLYVFLVLIVMIYSVELFFLFYFVFCGMASLTINLFIYDWLSLFTKQSIHIFLYVLSNLSNFGLFFILSTFIVITCKLFDSCKDLILNLFKKLIKNSFEEEEDDDDKQSKSSLSVSHHNYLCFFLLFGTTVLLYFVLFKWLFYITVIYEVFILMIVLSLLYKIYSRMDEYLNNHELAFSNKNPYFFDFLAQEHDLNNNDNNNNNEITNYFENILTINDSENENNNINLDNSNIINTDTNLDDCIFTFEIISDIRKEIEDVDYPEIVNRINSNIDSYNKKLQILNQVLSKLIENINSTNNNIANINKKDRIENINSNFKFIKFNVTNTKMLKELKDINDVMINTNNKISNYFINDVKFILFSLNNLNNIINSPDNDDYINRINYFVKK